MTQLPRKITANELFNTLSTQKLQHALVLQVCKDLGVEPFDVLPGTPSFFEELRREIYSVMTAVIENQPQSLPNMIYRIDLNEKEVKRLLQNTHQDTAARLSELILHREMKKVYIRTVLSQSR